MGGHQLLQVADGVVLTAGRTEATAQVSTRGSTRCPGPRCRHALALDANLLALRVQATPGNGGSASASARRCGCAPQQRAAAQRAPGGRSESPQSCAPPAQRVLRRTPTACSGSGAARAHWRCHVICADHFCARAPPPCGAEHGVPGAWVTPGAARAAAGTSAVCRRAGGCRRLASQPAAAAAAAGRQRRRLAQARRVACGPGSRCASIRGSCG
jgi:hypothetical protein